MAKTSIPREEKGGGRKRGRGAWERGVLRSGRREKERTREEESREMAPGEEVDGLVWLSGTRGERGVRGGGGIYGSHAEVQNTPRLKLETKTPVGAKPEISI